MKFPRLSGVIAVMLLAVVAGPLVQERREAARVLRRVHDLDGRDPAARTGETVATGVNASMPDPALMVRIEELPGLVASWQTIGGCGAGAGGGSSIGLKWIGRGVRGGLFNVQEQVSYTKIGEPGYPEYDFFSNTLITTDLGEKWNVGVNLPFIYKYLTDPTHIGGPGVAPVDYTNVGLGDINLLCTRKLGRINALSLTGIVSLPTGTYDARWTADGTPINQSQQIGFGWPTSNVPPTSLVLDQTFDEVWGLAVVGGVAAWRGGTNKIHNYRAPAATGYGYLGYFLGPFVPVVGLSVTGFTGHDRDQDAIQRTPLLSFAANLSIEWSSDWIALLAAASFPYGYDGIRKNESGQPRTPWVFFPWTVSLGVAVSPF